MADLEMGDDRLARELADLGAHVAFPAFADLRPAVARRIAAPRRRSVWSLLASPRYGLAPVLVTCALLLVAILASLPGARSAAEEILRLRGIEIFRGPVLTATPTPMTSSPASLLGLGERVSLEEAQRRADFTVRLPTDPLLGTPDEVYVQTRGTVTEVSLVYLSRAGVPTSPQAGVAALVSEIGNARAVSALFGKVIGPEARVAPIVVNGGSGFWIEGQPHDFFYRSADGSVVDEHLRLAGNTLLWERGTVLFRIEAQVDEATALRIAASFR